MSKPTYGEMRTRAERVYDSEVRDAVLAGLTVLQDKFGDGWEREINCDTLDMSEGAHCVLGQIYGDYDEGVEQMLDGDYDNDWTVDHGFNTNGDFQNLDEAWHAVLCDKEAIPGGAS